MVEAKKKIIIKFSNVFNEETENKLLINETINSFKKAFQRTFLSYNQFIVEKKKKIMRSDVK